MDNLENLITAEQMRKISDRALSEIKFDRLIEKYYRKSRLAINEAAEEGEFSASIIVFEGDISKDICDGLSLQLKQYGYNTEMHEFNKDSMSFLISW